MQYISIKVSPGVSTKNCYKTLPNSAYCNQSKSSCKYLGTVSRRCLIQLIAIRVSPVINTKNRSMTLPNADYCKTK